MKVDKNSRNLFMYWVGKEYKLIKILKNIIYLHSNNGKGYNLHLITNENINEYVTDLPKCFNKLLPAHQADVVRVNVVCNYGGIWIDADTLVIDSLDSLYDLLETHDGFFIKENNTHIWNGVFASKPNTKIMELWKNKINECLRNNTNGIISWNFIGSDIINKFEKQLYDNYKIFNGLDNLYPVNWCNCVDEFIKKPYENYKTIIRDFQPIVVLVNSVYKELEKYTEEEILNGNMPINYFISKALGKQEIQLHNNHMPACGHNKY